VPARKKIWNQRRDETSGVDCAEKPLEPRIAGFNYFHPRKSQKWDDDTQCLSYI